MLRRPAKVLLFVAFAWSSVMTSPARAAQLDLEAISDIDAAVAIALARDWTNADAVLTRHGLSDPAQIQLVTDLVPEILADIVFLHSGQVGRLADVQLVVSSAGQPDVSVSLRSLPLYETFLDALASGPMESELLAELVQRSGLASAVSQAIGADLDGAALAVAAIGIAHDGEELVLAAP